MYLFDLYCRIEFWLFRKLWIIKFKKEWRGCILQYWLFGGTNKIEIWNYVYIWNNIRAWWEWGLVIWDNTIIWPNVIIRSTNHDFKSYDYLPYGPWIEKKPVTIWKNCWIGDNVNITPGSTIWDFSIIWMWTIVHWNIPDYSIVVGSKLRVIKERNKHKCAILKQHKKYYLKHKLQWKK